MAEPAVASDEIHESERRHHFGWAEVGWVLVVIAILAAMVGLFLVVIDDDSRGSPFLDAHRERRSIGPTSGRLDDGTIVGAVSYRDPEGRICTLYGPPGDRGDELYCVTDTAEEVDAINWTVDGDAEIDMTVVVVEGDAPAVRFDFAGAPPGHALSWFPVPGPGLIAVYVGPAWSSLDVDTG